MQRSRKLEQFRETTRVTLVGAAVGDGQQLLCVALSLLMGKYD
jgi:hypothetical protein